MALGAVVTHGHAGLLRRENAVAARARANFVYPGVTHDAEHPAFELQLRLPLVVPQQSSLDCELHQVVGVVHVAGDGARKAAQSRQQLDDLTAHLLHLTHIYGWSRLFLPHRRGRLHRCVSYSLWRMSGPAMQRARLVSIRLSLCLLLGCSASAFGQIVPPVQVPNLPGLPTDQINRTVNDTIGGTLGAADPQQLREVRRLRIRELLRTNRAGLETDPRGAPIVRSEVVALSPAPAALESARAEGFTVGRTRTLEGL